MIVSFSEHLREVLQSEIHRLSADLARGSATTYDDYRHMTGIIQGLGRAEHELTSLVEAYEKDQDVH